MSPDLHLTTALTRHDAEGNPGECLVTLGVRIVSHRPGVPRSRHDDGLRAEHEFALCEVEWAEGEPEDCPGPFTDAELRTLLAWLVSPEGHREACEAVADRCDRWAA